mmetsp:Transcript_38417/g.110271  ORF Transcript_38417/g.110271 Transcript_38417/m.110271 type:complete len:320 (-) Transcript_38417:42-1001(-)
MGAAVSDMQCCLEGPHEAEEYSIEVTPMMPVLRDSKSGNYLPTTVGELPRNDFVHPPYQPHVDAGAAMQRMYPTAASHRAMSVPPMANMHRFQSSSFVLRPQSSAVRAQSAAPLDIGYPAPVADVFWVPPLPQPRPLPPQAHASAAPQVEPWASGQIPFAQPNTEVRMTSPGAPCPRPAVAPMAAPCQRMESSSHISQRSSRGSAVIRVTTPRGQRQSSVVVPTTRERRQPMPKPSKEQPGPSILTPGQPEPEPQVQAQTCSTLGANPRHTNDQVRSSPRYPTDRGMSNPATPGVPMSKADPETKFVSMPLVMFDDAWG